MEGRKILDAFLVANDFIEEPQSKRKKGVVIKLDVEKVRVIKLDVGTFFKNC